MALSSCTDSQLSIIRLARKKLDHRVTESSLRNNSKIILTEGGISPTILIGELPLADSRKFSEREVLLKAEHSLPQHGSNGF